MSNCLIKPEIIAKRDNLISKIVLLVEENSFGGKRHYRFCDVVKHLGYYWHESTKFIMNQVKFKGSILVNYIERCPDNNLEYVNQNYLQLLSEIVYNKLKDNCFKLPTENELVIHLRIGDIMGSKEYLPIISNYIKNNSINKITFCTAFHYGNNITQELYIFSDEQHNKNIRRLQNLFIKLLKNINIPIDIQSSANIDEDFIYMVMSKHFICDIGGFSKLISEMRNYILTNKI